MTRALTIVGAVLVLALASYAGVVTWMLGHERTRARVEARAGHEAALASAGAVVAKPAPPAELKEAARPIAKQIERAVAACPAARPVEVLTWRTDPVSVPCPPAPSPPTDATTPAKPSEVEIEVRGTEARFETHDGAVAAVGQIELWRPGAPAAFAERPWRADLSQFLRSRPQPVTDLRNKWAAGPIIEWSTAEVLYGAAIETPARRVGPTQARLVFAAVRGRRTSHMSAGALVSW